MTQEPGNGATVDFTDDRVLLAGVARRDRKAFEALYHRYYRRVFHFVLRIVRQDAAAEEVVSDVMFAVWQGAGTFAGGSRVSTWLLGIAYRQGMKFIEKDRKHSRVDSGDELISAAIDVHPGADPERAALDDSHATLLQKGMDSLSEQHRAVVELTATGHSCMEISQIVGCPEGTVRTRMFHARLQLKSYLDDAEGEHAADRAARPAVYPLRGVSDRHGGPL